MVYKFSEGIYTYLICPKCLYGYRYMLSKPINGVPLSMFKNERIMIDEIPENAQLTIISNIPFICDCLDNSYELLKYNHIPTYSMTRMNQLSYNVTKNQWLRNMIWRTDYDYI